MRTLANCDLNIQSVTPNQAAWRMHQHVVTNMIAFRVEALQNSQGALVQISGNGAL
jgi:hypothetical protein